MRRHLAGICVCLLAIYPLVAQNSIQSRVFDEKTGEALEMVTVRLFDSSDSTLVSGVQTDMRGGFTLNNIKPGRYYLLVTSVGYHDHKEDVVMGNKNILLKKIQLRENSQLLDEVEVRGTAAQMIVRGDTLEYNATAFKLAENAVVEDLLKRLPGVEIDTEGKITVNGEEIQKVRVDGKKFFDDDIEMATKNLPAEMIEKVQVLEEKSDMAKLTGFEDDDTERILNLSTKPNRRRGFFSNMTGGVGFDTDGELRYDLNGIVNIMEKNSQTTVTAGANNVNTSRSHRGRDSGNDGITTSQNIGINNNSEIGDKLKINANASFNHSSNESITDSYKLSYLKDSTYTDSTYTVSHKENYAAFLRLDLEWRPDSVNTFIFQPSVDYTRSFNDQNLDFSYMVNDSVTSEGNSAGYGSSSAFNVGLNFIYNHRFRKEGRTFTASLRGDVTLNESESYNYSFRRGIQSDTIDQRTFNQSDRYSFQARFSYVEPLWNVKNLLEIAATFQSTINTSIKNQYANSYLYPYANLIEYQMAERSYDTWDSEYSNQFLNRFYRENIELNYRRSGENYNLTVGVKAEPSQTYSYTTYGDGTRREVENEVVNFSPTARFRYNFDRKKFVRIDYRGTTTQPSVSQMQPVKDNSNIMNETVGNPSLNPSFSHRLRVFYSTFDDQRFSSFNASLNFTATKDALVSNTIYDNTGKCYNQTVNSEKAPLSVNGNVMYNTPIIQKRLHFNTSTNLSFNQRYGYSSSGVGIIDTDSEALPLGDLSSTQTYNAGESLSLTFTHDVIEVGVKGNVRFQHTNNNLNPETSTIWDWTTSGNIVLHLPYNFSISTDVNYTTRRGYDAGFDRDEVIWNASIDKSLFKNRGVLSVRCSDILRQRLNIRQSIGDNYIQTSSYNTLTSYVLVTFSYKLNRFGGRELSRRPDDNVERDGERPEHHQPGSPPPFGSEHPRM